jgi:hypothetical protein
MSRRHCVLASLLGQLTLMGDRRVSELGGALEFVHNSRRSGKWDRLRLKRLTKCTWRRRERGRESLPRRRLNKEVRSRSWLAFELRQPALNQRLLLWEVENGPD